MNHLGIRWGRFGRRPRRKTRGCVIHNKWLATPGCTQSGPSPEDCGGFGRLRRCEACEWNNHSPRLAPGAAERGYLHCGPAGAGHFVKMVQAYAEGFDILRNADAARLPADQRYDFALADIAELWRRGSVITSWLLDLSAAALAENPDLSKYDGVVQDSGESRRTVQAAIDEAVPAEVLSAALSAWRAGADLPASRIRPSGGVDVHRPSAPIAP